MREFTLALAALAFLASPNLRGDAFDHYTNPVLAKIPEAAGVLSVTRLTPGQLAEHAGVVPGTTAALLVVRTNDGRMSKLLVQPARQRLPDKSTVPILLIDRFVTYKPGEEQAIQAKGGNVRLFAGFQFSLDLGQVVPAEIGGDLRFTQADGKVALEGVGKAALYLVTKPMSEAAPKKAEKLVMGEKFEPRYFNGVYKLFDDGRRSGTLHLKVLDGGEVEGTYYSDKDGNKYEVHGKIGNVPYAIAFTVSFPRTQRTYSGWMFTGDGRAIAGSSRWQDHNTGFYAVRME
jgi:hypothetical protein